MSIKVIACDLDGTLLTNKHVLNKEVKDAITKAIACGVKFCIVTGRMFCSARIFAQQLDLDTPIVSYNGGLIKDAKTLEVYQENVLEKAVAQEVLRFCQLNDWYVQKYINDCLYVKEANDLALNYSKQVQAPLNVEGEDFYTVIHSPSKLMLVVAPADKERIASMLKEQFAGRIFITSSNDRFIEIIPLNVNKGRALMYLADFFDVDFAQIMACGDSFNDIEMLKLAGVGVVMGNAVPEVKEVATFVTASNEQNGVALAIEKFVL